MAHTPRYFTKAQDNNRSRDENALIEIQNFMPLNENVKK